MAATNGSSSSENDLLDLKIELAKNLLSRNSPRPKINNLLMFLRFYIRFENQESGFKFENTIDHITQNRETMGIEEFLKERFRREGETEKMATITRNLLRETSMSIEKIAQLVGASTEFVLNIKQGKNQDLSLE